MVKNSTSGLKYDLEELEVWIGVSLKSSTAESVVLSESPALLYECYNCLFSGNRVRK